MLNLIKIIKSKGIEPKVMLDVGTRDLDDSITFSKAFPNCRVIAFEPNPDQYKICLENKKFYTHRVPEGEGPFDNIEVYNYAISDVEGDLDFWVVGKNPGGSSLLEPIDVPYSDGTWKKITVKSRRLDNVLVELNVDSVDVVWMDVQGIELKALQGMGSILDTVKILYTEAAPMPYYKGHILKDDLEKFLIEKKFTLFWKPEGHPYGEGNFICIRQ
jgi:FkbM family methyltransferase